MRFGNVKKQKCNSETAVPKERSLNNSHRKENGWKKRFLRRSTLRRSSRKTLKNVKLQRFEQQLTGAALPFLPFQATKSTKLGSDRDGIFHKLWWNVRCVCRVRILGCPRITVLTFPKLWAGRTRSLVVKESSGDTHRAEKPFGPTREKKLTICLAIISSR